MHAAAMTVDYGLRRHLGARLSVAGEFDGQPAAPSQATRTERNRLSCNYRRFASRTKIKMVQ